MNIFLVGDIHKQWGVLVSYVDYARKRLPIDVVIQVGDMEITKGCMKELGKTWKAVGLPLHFIDGNHDDFEYLHYAHHNWLRYNIHYQKRGSILNIDGASVAFMGGALNVHTTQNIFPYYNYPQNIEIRKLIENCNKLPQAIDLMVTHSNPHSIGVNQHGSSKWKDSIERYITIPLKLNVGPIEDCGEPGLLNLWHGLHKKPSHWVYGHHHDCHKATVENTRFWGIGLPPAGCFLPIIYNTKTKQMVEI